MDNSVNKYLLDRAIPLGLCEPWQKLMQTATPDQLLGLYIKGIDFCLSNDFPSNADLKRLGGSALARYGIYIDANVGALDAPFMVLLGKCDAELDYSDYSASRLFVKHKSTCKVFATGNAFVDIDVFDNSTLHITAQDKATVHVAVYGNAQVTTQGNVKVTHKNKKTY